MARPIKVPFEEICSRYLEFKRANLKFPVKKTATSFSISTRTVNRALLKGIATGLVPEEMVNLPIFKPKQEAPKQELMVFW
jgi:hypothetical protein